MGLAGADNVDAVTGGKDTRYVAFFGGAAKYVFAFGNGALNADTDKVVIVKARVNCNAVLKEGYGVSLVING